MSPAAATFTVPGLGPTPRLRKLATATGTLGSGLRVLAVRRSGVPLVELRLRIEFRSPQADHPAQAELMADSLLAGTQRHDRADIASAVQALGGALHASVDADRLQLSGSALASGLPALLAVLAEVLTTATYPAAEVDRDRDRLVERLVMARSQAGVVAHEALVARMWGEHPYAHDMPAADAVAAVTRAQVRRLHQRRLSPDTATLVIVGDVSPKRAVDQAGAALADWTGSARAARIAGLPTPQPQPLLLIDRPGSVQSALRLGAPALPRTHVDAPALALANLVFGGYFSSRWVENIREDKGYTYSPRSSIDHRVLGSSFTAAADVASEVTAPALLETVYELGRLASLPASEEEVGAVRQYAIGTLALSVATQAGLAATLASLAGVGLGLDYLAAQPARLAAVTADEVSAAAAKYLTPAGMTGVVVGDAEKVAAPLERLGPLAR